MVVEGTSLLEKESGVELPALNHVIQEAIRRYQRLSAVVVMHRGFHRDGNEAWSLTEVVEKFENPNASHPLPSPWWQ